MKKSFGEQLAENIEKANQKRYKKQKESGYPCLDLYTKEDPWIYGAKCDSCEEYELDISKWKTTDDIKALLGQKCPKCGKDVLSEVQWAMMYDTVASLHKHPVYNRIFTKLWDLFVPKKIKNASATYKGGEYKGLKL